jgi:hypothetical protein
MEKTMNQTKVIVFCHKAIVDPDRQGSGDTSADEGVMLEPLRQEQRADGSQELKAEGKKRTQYMAAVFGKYQALALTFPRHCTCMTLYYFSSVCSEQW